MKQFIKAFHVLLKGTAMRKILLSIIASTLFSTIYSTFAYSAVSVVIEGSYIVTFKEGAGLVQPPNNEANRGTRIVPFGEHSTGQSKNELAAALGTTGVVNKIFETINAVHMLMDAKEADRLSRDVRVLSVTQNFLLTTADAGQTLGIPDTRVALGAGSPVFKDGLLTIPSVNTADQVGKYQDITFKLTEQGLWQLLGVKAIGAAVTGVPAIGIASIDKVDVVKTDSFPTQVFLRVSGVYTGCPRETIGQFNQRLENNRFDIAITTNFIRHDPVLLFACTADIVRYVRTIPLSVYGLRAGIYSYSVDVTPYFFDVHAPRKITGTFELTADNKYPGDY